MPKKKTFLNDPETELSDEEWQDITNAAGEKVRAESECMAKDREGRADPSDLLSTCLGKRNVVVGTRLLPTSIHLTYLSSNFSSHWNLYAIVVAISK